MKKQIVITRIHEFGGSNTYLKTVIKYFGKENIILVLTNAEDLIYLNKIDPLNELLVNVYPGFYDYVNFGFKKKSILKNIKEILYILRALSKIFYLSAKNGFASVTISVIDAGKYLYLFWLPYINVRYILHSDPPNSFNSFTSFTCNFRLGNKKKIITVSNANKNLILKYMRISKQNAGNVHVIYNCLSENQEERSDYLMDEEIQLVLTMGHVVEYKNPKLWLEVARRVVSQRKNTIFYWLGSGPQLELFQEQTKNCELIKFIGLVENTKPFIAKATIYYQPSLAETQGIAVIEAMSYNLPCVVSNVGGLPESIENNKNGFVVNANDVSENAQKIIELLDNKEICKSFGKYSYERYRMLFTYDKFKLEMNKLYNLN